MLEQLHNGQIEQAAKRATALLVKRSLTDFHSPRQIGVLMDCTLRDLAPDYQATTATRWTQYANGVAVNLGNGEGATNRRWGAASDEVKAAARALADLVSDRLNACGPAL